MTEETTQPPLGAALTPLLARYSTWMGLDDAAVLEDRDEDPDEVRALQLVLRMERGNQPSWHAALALSASATALLCLDPQWAAEVTAYCGGHIRKVTRRARGAQWEATAELSHVGLSTGLTEVRAFVPGLVIDLDKRLAKLQVGGTEVPVDAASAPPAVPHLSLIVPDEPALTAGKLMAQTGHAGMIAAALLAHDAPDRLRAWADLGCPAHVSRVPAAEFSRRTTAVVHPERAWRDDALLAVRDAGFTEVAPGTVTVLAVAP